MIDDEDEEAEAEGRGGKNKTAAAADAKAAAQGNDASDDEDDDSSEDDDESDGAGADAENNGQQGGAAPASGKRAAPSPTEPAAKRCAPQLRAGNARHKALAYFCSNTNLPAPCVLGGTHQACCSRASHRGTTSCQQVSMGVARGWRARLDV